MTMTNTAVPTMLRENSHNTDEAAVRAVLGAISNAVRARDVEAMLAHCAPDIATFDMVPPLKHVGADAVRRVWAAALATFDSPVEYEVDQLDLAVGSDVAFCRSLNRFGGTTRDGKHIANWLCSTLGLRKLDGQWKVVHEHVSVPFDMKTGKALLDLKPADPDA
jgi:ketosteroid isomerase-like protein